MRRKLREGLREGPSASLKMREKHLPLRSPGSFESGRGEKEKKTGIWVRISMREREGGCERTQKQKTGYM